MAAAFGADSALAGLQRAAARGGRAAGPARPRLRRDRHRRRPPARSCRGTAGQPGARHPMPLERLLTAAWDGDDPARRPVRRQPRSAPVPHDVPAEQQAREDELVDAGASRRSRARRTPRTAEVMQALDPAPARLPPRGAAHRGGVAARRIEFLTAVGHITDDRRQEFILLSDVLGASMQTVAINNEAYGDATEATVFGPFFVDGRAARSSSAATSPAAPPGEPCWVEGTVTDTDGSAGPRRPDRGVGGRRGRLLRRPVRRRPHRRARRTCSPTTRAATRSGPSPPRRTRSRTTARSARCSPRPGARRCAPRTCTSW